MAHADTRSVWIVEVKHDKFGWRAIKRMGKSGQHICPACVAAADARRALKEAA